MYLGPLNNVKIESGHTLLLQGPVEFTIKSGQTYCLGGAVENEASLIVEELRQEPIFVEEIAEVELRAGEGGTWTDLAGSTTPVGWMEAAQILQQQKGVAIIVGEVDSGKSTLTTLLANLCLDSGLTVEVIDGDVGQADIGPPATISGSRISEPIRGLYHAKSDSSYFAGDTSPASIPGKVVNLVARLKTEIEKDSDVVIVNTDGWIGEPTAVRYKHALLDRLKPDLVLSLSRGEAVTSLLDSVPYTSMRLTSSPYAKTRSKEERKQNRESGYRRFLAGSRVLNESHETTQLRMFDQPSQSLFRGDRRFHGFLVGLLDTKEKLLGIGRIREMRTQDWTIETRVEEQARFIEIGNLVLSSRYEEVGYGTLH